jgi:MFS family permease
MIGSLFSGPFAKYGRWKCILLTNIFVIIGSVLSLMDNYILLITGRLLYGVAAGSFSVFCPKYINETAPTSIKGSLGALS